MFWECHRESALSLLPPAAKPCLRPPLGSPLEHRMGRTELGHHRAGAPGAAVSAHKRGAFALPRSLCSGSPLSQPAGTGGPCAGPGWQPLTAGCQELCPSPGHSHRQDPAPASLVSWQRHELVMLWVRPAPHLIAPLARSKINSTLYTLAASALMFWHICEVKKKK